ncbi:MAG: hypothetical protein ACFCU6_12130, partial [Balneolaceae bacterium]
MNIQKVSAENLAEARKKASILFNNQFVILESAESKPGFPASITVAVDGPFREKRSNTAVDNKHVHLLKPLLSQAEEFLSRGTKSVSKLKHNVQDFLTESLHENESNYHLPHKKRGLSDIENQKREGVFFEKSRHPYTSQTKTASAKFDNPQANENTDYELNYENKNINKPGPEIRNKLLSATSGNGDDLFHQIQKRLQILENFTRLIGRELIPDVTGNPLYGQLVSQKFIPELLIDWFMNEQEFYHQPAKLYAHIKQQLMCSLKPVSEVCKPGVYLFTGFTGSDLNGFVSDLIRYNIEMQPETFTPVIVH